MSEDVKFTRKRQINPQDIGGNDIGGALLVPGGRWLLVGGIDGSVAACDLDASIITVKPLIPPDEDNRQRVHFMAIDMKSANQCPNLTFTLASSPASHLGKISNRLDRAQLIFLQDRPLVPFLSKFTSRRSL